MKAWEYTVLTFEIPQEPAHQTDNEEEKDRSIAELGAGGWELVTVVPLALGNSQALAVTTHERWVFKRPIDSNGHQHATVDTAEAQEPSDTPPLSAMKEISNRQ